jgi:hypothetical protein
MPNDLIRIPDMAFYIQTAYKNQTSVTLMFAFVLYGSGRSQCDKDIGVRGRFIVPGNTAQVKFMTQQSIRCHTGYNLNLLPEMDASRLFIKQHRNMYMGSGAYDKINRMIFIFGPTRQERRNAIGSPVF